MQATQDYNSHTRWHPIYHYVLAPIMLIHVIYTLVRLVQDPGWDRAEFFILSIGLVILTLLARVNALKAQDRVIRLEERLRFEKVLSPELAERASNFRASHLIALRFAPDSELTGLVQKIVDGELSESKEIKLAIKDWRPDFFRV